MEGEGPNRAVSDLGGSRANRTSVTSRRSPANGYPPHAGPDDVFGAAAGVERLHLELHNRCLFDSCLPERSRHQADDVAGVFLSAGEKPVELDLDVWVLGAGRVRLFAGVRVGCRYYFGLLLDPLSAEGASTAAGLPFRTALEDFDDCRHLGFLPDKGRTPLGNQHRDHSGWPTCLKTYRSALGAPDTAMGYTRSSRIRFACPRTRDSW